MISDLELARRRLRRRRLVRGLIALTLLLAVIVAVCTVLVTQQGTLREQLDELLSNFDKGPGYPVEYPGGTNPALYPMGGNLALVTDTNLFVYNRLGGQLSSAQHRYHDPIVKTTASYALLYDVNDTGLTVFNKSRQVFDTQLAYPLYAADIRSDRTIAVATRAEHYTSEVRVFQNFDTEALRFDWLSAEKMVSALALSLDGDGLAVGAVGASGGILQSTLHLFSIGEQQERAVLELPDEFIYHLDYKEDGSLQVITDRRTLTVDQKGNIVGEYSYGGRVLSQFTGESPGGAVLLLGNFAQERHTALVSLDTRSAQRGEARIDYEVSRLAAYQDCIALAGPNLLAQFDGACTLAGQQTASNIQALTVAQSGAYAVADRQLLALGGQSPTLGESSR